MSFQEQLEIRTYREQVDLLVFLVTLEYPILGAMLSA